MCRSLRLSVHGRAHGSLLGAHLAFNLGGWLGGAIVGTLHTFAPSLTRSMLHFPRLQPLTFGFWSSGIGLLALGYGFGNEGLAIAGWSLLVRGRWAVQISRLGASNVAKEG